jgi:tetratricopeptide (TPR) repeat protein
LRNKLVLLAALVVAASLAAGAALPPPNLDRTLAAQQALIASKPTAERHNDLGNLLLLAGRAAAAQEAYEEALRLDPDLISGHYNLALLFQQRGEGRKAMRHFRAVVERQPDHARAWFQIGFLHETAGAEGPAVRAYGRAYLLDPRLSFADENPQVLDSKLTTRSLLAAQSKISAAGEAPRHYEEPRRIAGLLLPAAPPAGTGPGGEAPAETTAAAPAARVVPAIPGGPADPLAASGDRVLGPQDLRPGSRVGEVTTAPGVRGSVTHLPRGGEEGDYGELLRQRLMQQEEMRRLEEAGGDGGPTPPPYYLPGPRTTGQLEQRLEDRLAARQPAAARRG